MNVIIVPCTQRLIWDTHPAAGAVAAKDRVHEACISEMAPGGRAIRRSVGHPQHEIRPGPTESVHRKV